MSCAFLLFVHLCTFLLLHCAYSCYVENVNINNISNRGGEKKLERERGGREEGNKGKSRGVSLLHECQIMFYDIFSIFKRTFLLLYISEFNVYILHCQVN